MTRLLMENAYKLRALKLSTIAIASVVIVELFLGLIVDSLAIMSDGLHALLDAITTLVLFIATAASLKPPDEEHMYGHEKFESIGGLVGGIALIGVAMLIMYEAIIKIFESKSINTGLEFAGFIAIGYTFCIDFFRVGTFLKARKSESTTMKAGFFHAIADLSSTVIALLGFGLASAGFYYGDSVASMVLSVLLTYLSVKLVWNSGMELSDATSKEITEKIRKQILATKGVQKCENLKVRRAGSKIFVEAAVQAPDYMSLEEAHDLASKVEFDIRNSLGNADVIVHTEPTRMQMETRNIVEKLATEVEGVKGAHDIEIVYTDGKLHIILHAFVNPKISIDEAHEIAGKIEKKIGNEVKDVEDVTVHIEPFSTKPRKGPVTDEKEIREIVHKTAEDCQQAVKIMKIVTYIAGKKRYINIDCCFTEQISIEDAHKTASKIEDKIKEHFTETEVTVHMESG